MTAKKNAPAKKKMLAATNKRSDKLELFCQAYVGLLGNGRQAYLAAGYAKKSADVEVWKTLQLPKVRERIRELCAENHDGIIMNKEETLREISLIARANPKNVFDQNGKLLHVQQMDLPTQLSVQEIELTQLGDGEVVTHKIKFGKDKMAALEKLMRHHNAYEVEQGEQGVFRTYYKIPQDALL